MWLNWNNKKTDKLVLPLEPCNWSLALLEKALSPAGIKLTRQGLPGSSWQQAIGSSSFSASLVRKLVGFPAIKTHVPMRVGFSKEQSASPLKLQLEEVREFVCLL